MKRRDQRWRVPVAVAAAVWVWVGNSLTGADAFTNVGEINVAMCTRAATTVSDSVNATSPGVAIEYEDCSTEVVKVVAGSDGNTLLDLRDIDKNGTCSTATSGKLTNLQNFSIPDNVSTLNFSSNPITRISGVVFPNSLKVLFITSTVGLKEFEIRQTDATLFATLDAFNVSTVTDVTCSDSNAMIRYVNETLLCVLSDEAFEQKYYGEKDSKSASGSVGGAEITQAPELKVSITQRRSKFLILSVVMLSLAFVALLVLLAMRNIHDRIARGRRARLPKVYHPVLASKKTWWDED
ncbi:hypothetical protein JM18_009223 [Phytophthora kernoviae]|uniref:Uncharacterized protein n=1 Tax=Phytophthora kernoviae TaxID=325452 RepID=A0A8T0LKB1_9STRA|nr:hypothetical protein JM16_008965 [Phytophthora kernoviae]KAG2508221.1 hypothetical protein JM18_009223 [Phytophthora kernoviae]